MGRTGDTSTAHLVVGGFPPGEPAGHDMDFARLRLLELLAEGGVRTTVAGDFADLDRWLDRSGLLVTYVAGPFPDEAQNQRLRAWLADGGRWLALHGTSGGKAARVQAEGDHALPRRMMVKLDHHHTLGSFFLNHPPLRRFRVDVTPGHPLAEGLPASFDVDDELYLLEILEPEATDVLLTTELPLDPSPPRFGFAYPADTALQPDGRTRVLGYTKAVGRGWGGLRGPGPLPLARLELPAVRRHQRGRRRPHPAHLPRLLGRARLPDAAGQRRPLGPRLSRP